MVAIATCPGQLSVSFQVQRREPVGETTVAELLLLLLTRVQTLEATVRPDSGKVVHVSKTIWQSLVVVLFEAIRRRVVLGMGGVRPIRILQRVEAVAGGRESGAGPLQRLELKQGAGSRGGGRSRRPGRRRIIVQHRLMLLPLAPAVVLAPPSPLLPRRRRIAFAPAPVQPFVFPQKTRANVAVILFNLFIISFFGLQFISNL